MARCRIPPDLRRRTWAEGSVWDLLIASDLLPYRFASPFADLRMTVSQRRRLHREEELLKITRIAYILPRPATARRPLQPWLYIRARRTGHYRVSDAGAIERYGKRIQHLGSGSITEHRWYPCTLRGVRWLQVVADGLVVQKMNQLQAPRAYTTDTAALTPAEPAGATEKVAAAEQLRLFP